MKNLKNDFVILGLSLFLAFISICATVVAVVFSANLPVLIMVIIIAIMSLAICVLACLQLKKSAVRPDEQEDDKTISDNGDDR